MNHNKKSHKDDIECNLSAKNIKSETIEATYNSLLNVQTKTIKSPHGRQQQTGPPTAKHMYIHCSSFPLPHFNLK